jgi:transposase
MFITWKFGKVATFNNSRRKEKSRIVEVIYNLIVERLKTGKFIRKKLTILLTKIGNVNIK